MKHLFALLLTVILLGSCGKTGDGREVSLRFDWIPTMSFAGDIVGMNKHARENNIKLVLHPAGEGIDPIKMVVSGVDNVGIIGLDKLLLANEKGADLVAFGIVDNVTPTVFISKKELNILTPQDFVGKKVGIQSGGATEFVYRTLIHKLKIDESKVTEVQIGFDMKPFIEGQYDVRPGFIFDEAVYLDLNGIAYNLIEPRQYGLNYPGRVYFSRREFIKQNPQLIQSFVNTVGQGWRSALSDPEDAIKQLQTFEPKINYQREFNGLLKAKEYFSGYQNRILTPDTAALDDMVLNLSDLQIIKERPKVEDYFDLQFVNAFNNSHGNAKE